MILYLLVTIFGLGPAMFADGTDQERIITLVIVVGIYVLLTILLCWFLKKGVDT